MKFRDHLGDIAAQELQRLSERVRVRSEKLRSKENDATEQDQDDADTATKTRTTEGRVQFTGLES